VADDDSAATRAVGVGGILLTVVLRCGHAPAQGHAGVLGQGEGEGTPLPPGGGGERTDPARHPGAGGRHHLPEAPEIGGIVIAPRQSDQKGRNGSWRVLAELSVPSEPGNERRATEEVAKAVSGLGLPERTLERLKTAVAEATMNAMEHGNRYNPEVPVEIRLLSSDTDLFVRITDQGGSPVPTPDTEVPDLEAKLEGMQTPRGWGLFLIQNMVDEMHITSDEVHHTVGLVMHLAGGEDAD
jgi:serine/threonine-protein kinase RsbW